MMDTTILEVLSSLPNVAIAGIALWWASRIIEKMIDNESKRMDAFLAIVKQVSDMRNRIELEERDADKPADPVTATPQT